MYDEPVLYDREGGVICYQVPVFGNWMPNGWAAAAHRNRLETMFNELVSTSLGWIWQSQRTEVPADPEDRHRLPEMRPATLLTATTRNAFFDDLSERNVDGYSRQVDVFGADMQSAESLLDESALKQSLRDFAVHEKGPLRIVVMHIGDFAVENVFVPHSPVAEVENLLAKWGIMPGKQYRTRPYRRLGVTTLEWSFKL